MASRKSLRASLRSICYYRRVVSLLRKGRTEHPEILIVCNFTPVPRLNYRVGAPRDGLWQERLNSDAQDYGGSGVGNMGEVEAALMASHGRRFSLSIALPPLAIVFFTNESR